MSEQQGPAPQDRPKRPRVMSERVTIMPPDPRVSIMLDEQLRKGIAVQLRTLADLLDAPQDRIEVIGQ